MSRSEKVVTLHNKWFYVFGRFLLYGHGPQTPQFLVGEGTMLNVVFISQWSFFVSLPLPSAESRQTDQARENKNNPSSFKNILFQSGNYLESFFLNFVKRNVCSHTNKELFLIKRENKRFPLCHKPNTFILTYLSQFQK